ncbi:MAG: drug/metabolite transporter (DMT)-like permease [Polaribacter sp.]|jgi:drug/metabolite transporter (DMT)-like permease
MLNKNSDFAKAVLFILLALLLFDTQAAIIKHLGDRYPVQQLASFRNIFGLLPSILVLILSQEWHRSGRKVSFSQWRFGLFRGLILGVAQYCFYLGITKLPFATATTLTYIGPIFITILSIPILKHSVGVWRWAAVATGFIGVVLVIRPGTDIFTIYILLPLIASFGYSLSTICVRLIDNSIPTALINLYSSIGALACSAAILFFTTGYVPVKLPTDWLWLLAMGMVGGFAVFCMITAYRLTKPSKLSPFEYFGIPFAFIIGWLIFDETPFDRLFPGVIFIICGGLIVAWRERKYNITSVQNPAK